MLKIFKNLFEGGLDIQKQRLRELKTYAKEKRQEHKIRQKEELQSMENYYRDQVFGNHCNLKLLCVKVDHQE